MRTIITPAVYDRSDTKKKLENLDLANLFNKIIPAQWAPGHESSFEPQRDICF